MKLLALAAALSLVTAAQSFEVLVPTPETTPVAPPTAAALFTPIRTTTFKREIGRGYVTLWTVMVCNRTSAPIQIRREHILMTGEAIHITALPNEFAQDAVTRQAARDSDSVIGSNGNAAITLALGVMSGLGIAKKSTNTIYAAAAISAAQYFVSAATKRAPNPTPYFSRLLPSVIPLGTGGDGACETWYLLASPNKDARPILIEVRP